MRPRRVLRTPGAVPRRSGAKQERRNDPRSQQACSRPSISVLMSTYAKEKASNLEAALESLWTQTELPDQVVLVLDGPVGAEQEEVVAGFAARGGVPELASSASKPTKGSRRRSTRVSNAAGEPTLPV